MWGRTIEQKCPQRACRELEEGAEVRHEHGGATGRHPGELARHVAAHNPMRAYAGRVARGMRGGRWWRHREVLAQTFGRRHRTRRQPAYYHPPTYQRNRPFMKAMRHGPTIANAMIMFHTKKKKMGMTMNPSVREWDKAEVARALQCLLLRSPWSGAYRGTYELRRSTRSCVPISPYVPVIMFHST